MAPRESYCWLHLGEACLASRDWGCAESSFRRSIAEARPVTAEALYKLGNLLLEQHKRPAEALAFFRRIKAVDPKFKWAYNPMGLALRSLGRDDEALAAYDEGLALDPEFAELWLNKGYILTVARNDPEAAIACYERAIALRPGWAEALFNMGNLLLTSRRDRAGARARYEESLKANPRFYPALYGLGNLLYDLGDLAGAERRLRAAIEANPREPSPYNALANVMRANRDPKGTAEAIDLMKRVLEFAPDDAATLINLANAHIAVEQNKPARKYLKRALKLTPDNAHLHSNLGDALRNDEFYLEAIPHYARAYELDPTLDAAFCNLVYALQFVSDWSNSTRNFAHLQTLLKRQSREPVTSTTHPCVHPFMALAYPLPVEVLLDTARFYAGIAAARAREMRVPALKHLAWDAPNGLATPKRVAKAAAGAGVGKVIRIGYIGFEFGNFPVGKDMRSVFGLHDRSKVEVFAYALNPDDGSPWRKWIAEGVDHFRDFSATDTRQCAERIARDGVTILVSLTGYTRGERSEILALRPAPIQVFFKGFMGTSGADFADYILSDADATPPEMAPLYTERLALLGNGSFFVSDYRAYQAAVVDPANPFRPTRKEHGLPEDGFVFACFNQLYKVDAATMDAWARILLAVPRSVLWLPRFPPDGTANIALEAERRGVDRSRVIFLGKFPDAQHLVIKGLADLFLDTPLYNAHGTATDILWAGVPLLTFQGSKMASRVAASLLRAIGTPELITRSMRDYERLAVRLATDKAWYAEIKKRVMEGRLTSSLFSTEHWVRRAEGMYQSMLESHLAKAKAKRNLFFDL